MGDRPSKMRPGKFEAARVARVAAVQAMFQIFHQSLSKDEVIEQFLRYRLSSKDYPCVANKSLFADLVNATLNRLEEIDHIIEESLTDEYTLDRLDPVLKAILRVGAAELLNQQTKIPPPVVISEYVDITKGFYEGTEPAFVNSLLDSLAKKLGLSLTPHK